MESIDHFFLHCGWTWKLWTKCMGWWDIVCSPNMSLRDWFLGWTRLCPSNGSLRVWKVLFCAVVWSSWEARNQMVFNGKVPCLDQYADTVKFRAVWWFKHLGFGCIEPITLLLLDI
ncbi:hypothetical protein Dsin_032727 [Dipteronia sinensis]|uniref:Reverse transcriptase zinc-binding domain-containing protein n=1 Tax=Dipteronia sinensis TaxID=43782 RepID=A0AAD9Z6N2_9ROSI|nr:hypothetical protein Dsin_032727 [Dipteronia sinensis]